MSDEQFKQLAEYTGAISPDDALRLWQGCVERVTHGITTIREYDGWTILSPQKADCGVKYQDWTSAARGFARTLL